MTTATKLKPKLVQLLDITKVSHIFETQGFQTKITKALHTTSVSMATFGSLLSMSQSPQNIRFFK